MAGPVDLPVKLDTGEQNDTPGSIESRCSSSTIINMFEMECVGHDGISLDEGYVALCDIWFIPSAFAETVQQAKYWTI